jgi:Raf kinase inhibitor-like YbhB/YbcL family protein
MQNTTCFLHSLIAAAAISLAASTAFSANLNVSFEKSQGDNRMPPEYASCVTTEHARSAPGANKSPGISWSAGPKGTRSYALALVDPDVPADFSMFNKDGVIIRKDSTRVEFVHWLLADIPARINKLSEGADSGAPDPGGFALERTDHGKRGQNGAGGGSLKNGPHGDYMGACPPWNDERVHGYHLTVYALDVSQLDLPALFTRADVLTAMKGHVLATGTAVLFYSLNEKATK